MMCTWMHEKYFNTSKYICSTFLFFVLFIFKKLHYKYTN